MSESVSLPALGESVTEGTVTRWLKNVGDRVEVDEPLLEVSTDKVDTEIPSPVAGVIEAILVQEDETVEVGTALVTIGDGSGAGAAPAEPAAAEPAPAATEQAAAAGDSYATPAPEDEVAPAAPAPAAAAERAPEAVAEVPSPEAPAPGQEDAAPVAPPTPTPVDPAPAAAAPAPAAPAPAAPAPAAPAPAAPAPVEEQRGSHAGLAGYVTPIVRKLANEAGVDLSTISGTGVGGRIRKQDIAAAQAASSAPAAAAVEVSPLRGTTQPMSRLRKVVAERAVISMQTSAQLTTVVEVDVTRVAMLRDKVKADFQAKTGTKLSFLPFFALAAAEALQANPVVNATIDGDSIVYPAHENISIAVDTERGLLTPVVRNAADLDLAGFATQIADLAARTRDNKLKPDELAGGTFTLTNTGSRGALFDTPVVFLPQSAILGTGIVYKKPVVVSADGLDSIAIRSTVYLALSYDHRIIDGADAARFLTTMKQRLEAGAFENNLGI
ncbi:MAG TPA: 2-oxoglutarate dehydrogenase, E2 component, dihydrolipoamide succinyltransferase [Glaciibacter sp.]|nr:2-oxoglutarate dehydrogenase, E2 component, dihydrolipoamide succinyltransferase [Glaciibacter sp.]